MIVTLDFETSIHNKGNPFDKRNFPVSVHIKYGEATTAAYFSDDPYFKTAIRSALDACSLLVCCNGKFDLHYVRRLNLTIPERIRIWDCMLAEFILSGQTNSFVSLNELSERYGLGQKEDEVAEYWKRGISTEFIPRDIVSSYGNRDIDLTHAVYLAQLSDSRMVPALERLILLDGLDLLVLEEMEYNGFKYDRERSLERAGEAEDEIWEIENELATIAGKRINFDSGIQLSCFLFGGSFTEDVTLPVTKIYKSGPNKGLEYTRNEFQRTDTHTFPGYFKPLKGTALASSTEERQLYSTAEDVLLQLKASSAEQRRILQLLSRRAKLSKLRGTYLLAFPQLIDDMYWEDDLIHGTFNQVVARTGRLSSSKPNMQNAPLEVDEFFISRFD